MSAPRSGHPVDRPRRRDARSPARQRGADEPARPRRGRRPAQEHRLAAASRRSSATASSTRPASAASSSPARRSCASPIAAALERHLVELAEPALEAVAEASGETVNLSVPTPYGVDHLAQVDGRHFLGAGQWVGRRVDYHCTANGKVFLAFGAAEIPPGPLARLTTDTVVSRAALDDRARARAPRRLRHRRRRARGRPERDRRARPRADRRRHRRAQHLGPDAAPDAARAWPSWHPSSSRRRPRSEERLGKHRPGERAA